MNNWVFKATPPAKDGSGYDYAQELRVGREENWESVKAVEPLRVGDRVFFWASSPLRHLAGLGVITQIHGDFQLSSMRSTPPMISKMIVGCPRRGTSRTHGTVRCPKRKPHD